MLIEKSPQELQQAREAWKTMEPYHGMLYFSPEARDAFKAAGLKGYWMGYFASRAAALGAASANLVTATFYNFHPRMVARAIPDAWKFASPERVLVARYQAADAVLRRLLGDLIVSPEMSEAASLAREATLGCDIAGRPLFAAHAALDWPTEPHLVLWHAATLLREFRGDGHIVALLSEGLDGCEAHITLAGTGITSRQSIQPARGWTDEEWEISETRLRERGLLDEAGKLTEKGRALRQAVEDKTDRLALPPWRHLGEERYRRLLQLVYPLSAKIVAEGGVPQPNPMGLSWEARQ
ncbi:MAG TPA: hypothetical protein VFN23_17370 [Ktedonobacteraceae bacterium]|nr:hypothetical protein [Ktedonobacteraceae bacterium]